MWPTHRNMEPLVLAARIKPGATACATIARNRTDRDLRWLVHIIICFRLYQDELVAERRALESVAVTRKISGRVMSFRREPGAATLVFRKLEERCDGRIAGSTAP